MALKFTDQQNIDRFTMIADTKNNSYDDTVPDAQRYSYKTSAYNSKGESSLSTIYSSALSYPTLPT
jgi:uncharacterized protein YxeA